MAVLEGRNILHADVVEADIVRGLLHAVEPWLDVAHWRKTVTRLSGKYRRRK